jgi:hypothetical protein
LTIQWNATLRAPYASKAAIPSEARKISIFAAAVIAVTMGDSFFRRHQTQLHGMCHSRNLQFPRGFANFKWNGLWSHKHAVALYTQIRKQPQALSGCAKPTWHPNVSKKTSVRL